MKTNTNRQSVVDLCIELAQRGFLAGTGGNIALRIDRAYMAVTPSGTDYYAMSANDVCVIRIDDMRQVEGNLKPSVESSLHARVLHARPDCACSIHTHQPTASAFALLGSSLTVESPETQRLLGTKVAFVGYAPSGTGWLAWKLAKAIRPDINAYLMRNHGVLCCASDIARGLQTVAALESLAAAQLRRLIATRIANEPSNKLWLQNVQDALSESLHPVSASVI